MLPSDPSEELARLRKRKLWATILEAPGWILLGLGVFLKFGTDSAQIHPVLAKPVVANGLLVVGGLIAAWGVVQMVPLIARIGRLEKELRK
jgi:hypothetical protein